MAAGAAGYLTKGCPATEIVQAIRTVARGGRHIGSTVAQQMALAMLPGRKATPFEALSARELEVLMMLAEGRRVAEIASIVADECFWDLDGPIVRITTPHIPLPSADQLEDHTIPSVERIVSTIREKVD